MSLQRLNPVIFVHFKDVTTGDLMYVPMNPQPPSELPNPPIAYDFSKPIGVRAYGPGSKESKAVDASIVQSNLDARAKKVTASLLERNAIAKLAGVTIEFVNFDYDGAACSLPTATAFYSDPGYAHLRDQVQEALGDFSVSL